MDISSDLVSILYNLDNNKKVQGGLLPHFIGCNSHSIWHSIQITIISTSMIRKYVQTTPETTKCLVKIIKGLTQVIKMYSLDFHVPKVYGATPHLQKFMYASLALPEIPYCLLKEQSYKNFTILCCFHKEFSVYKQNCKIRMLKTSIYLCTKFDMYEFKDMIRCIYFTRKGKLAITYMYIVYTILNL